MTELTVIEPEAAVASLPAAMGDPEVADLATSAVPLMEQARAFVIDSPESDAAAKALLAQVSKAVKRTEALRKRWTKPILDHKRRIDHDFNRISEPAKAAERILREKVALYHVERQRAALEAAKAAAADAGMNLVPAPPAAVETDAGIVTMRASWDFTVIAPDKVPAEYLVVDVTKIRAAIRAGVRSIPGVDIFETATTVVR